MPPARSFAGCWPTETIWSRASKVTAWPISRRRPRRRGALWAGPRRRGRPAKDGEKTKGAAQHRPRVPVPRRRPRRRGALWAGPRRRGRPAKYGKKIKVAALLKEEDQLQEAPSPVYGEQGVSLRSRGADRRSEERRVG